MKPRTKRQLAVMVSRNASKYLPVFLLAVILLALFYTSYKIDAKQWFAGSTLLRGKYEQWSSSLLGNVLGVIAQVIGVVITVLLTGIFVVWQYLGNSLPPKIVRPLLLGRTAVLPLVALFLLLAYDVCLFVANRDAFLPLIGVCLVAAGAVLAVPCCLITVLYNVRSVNALQVVQGIGDQAKQAMAFDDVLGLWHALEDLVTTLVFLVQTGQTETAIRAFDLFLDISEKWSDGIRAHFEIISGKKGKEPLNTIGLVLSNGPQMVLDVAVKHHNSIVFSLLLRRIAARLLKIDVGLRKSYMNAIEGLSQYDQGLWDVEFTNGLILAADLIAHNGLLDNEELFDFGVDILSSVWAFSFEGHDVQRFAIIDDIIQLATRVEREIEKNGTSKLQTRRQTLVGIYQFLGADIVEKRAASLYGIWIDGLTRIISECIEQGAIDGVDIFLDAMTDVYDTSIYCQCEPIYRVMPLEVRFVLTKADSKYHRDITKMIFKFKTFVNLALHSGNEGAMQPLADLFRLAYDLSTSQNDHETAERAMDIISRFPLKPSILSNNIAVFFKKEVEAVKRAERKAGPVLNGLFNLIANNSRSTDESLYFVVNLLKELVTSGALGDPEQLSFVEFCISGSSQFDSMVRNKVFDALNDFMHHVKNPEVLAAALKNYKEAGLDAVERGDEMLVRTVSNYMGWLAYGVVTADVALDKKRKTVSDVMDGATAMYRLAVIYGLSQSTIVFLSTLFAVLGAVCEEMIPAEREVLLSIAVDAAFGIGDLPALERGVAARIHAEIPLDELKGKGRAPYQKFAERVRSRYNQQQVATGTQPQE